VQGSRQGFRGPPVEEFASLKQASELPLAVATDCDQYLHERLTLLETQLTTVNRMALAKRRMPSSPIGTEDHAIRSTRRCPTPRRP
jgi:hypothetical protein